MSKGYNPRRMRSRLVLPLLVVLFAAVLGLSAQSPPAAEPGAIVLRPARVFDGETMHEGWAVRASGERIEAAGLRRTLPANARVVDLAGLTLTPGLVRANAHPVHPYNERPEIPGRA
jgi:hypothetical protein